MVGISDTLETLLASELSGWDLSRRKVIDEGQGVGGGNAATYALASKECLDDSDENWAAILALYTRQTAYRRVHEDEPLPQRRNRRHLRVRSQVADLARHALQCRVV